MSPQAYDEASAVDHASAVGMYGTLTAEVKRFYDALLDSAARIIDDSSADGGAYAAAIALLGTACEVAAGTAAKTIVEQKGLGPVATAAIGWIRDFNLTEERIRATWNAVAGDTIQNEGFWQDFVEHVKRRNKVVHTGTVDGSAMPTKVDAEASLDAARRLVTHVKDVLTANGLGSWT